MAFGLMANSVEIANDSKPLLYSYLCITLENEFSHVSGLLSCIILAIFTVVNAVLK